MSCSCLSRPHFYASIRPRLSAVLLALAMLSVSQSVRSQESAWTKAMETGVAEFNLGNMERAESEFNAAIAISEKYFGDTDYQALSLFWIGTVYLFGNRPEEAQIALSESVEVMDSIGLFNAEHRTNVHENIGYALIATGEFHSADTNWQLALKYYNQLPHVDEYDVAVRMHDYCYEFKEALAFEQAEPCYKTAIEICIEERTKISECGSMLFNELGEVYAGGGVLSDAKSAFDTSIGIAQKLGTAYFEAMMLSNAGKSYSFMEQYEVAEQHLLKALSIVEKEGFYDKVPEDVTRSSLYMMTAVIHVNLANNYAQIGNSSAAMSYVQKATSMCSGPTVDEEICDLVLSLVPMILARSEGKNEESNYEMYKVSVAWLLKSGVRLDEVKEMIVNANPEIAARIFDPNSLPEPQQGDDDWYRSWWLSSDEVETPSS